MGRNIRTSLPQVKEHFCPLWEYVDKFRNADEVFKQKQKSDFDRRHRTRVLPNIPTNTGVWISTGGNPIPGQTVGRTDAPRSYKPIMVNSAATEAR